MPEAAADRLLRAARALALVLLLAGCAASAPPGSLEFDRVDRIAELEGTYRNCGEGAAGARPVYLSSLLWPGDETCDHAAIESIRVAAAGADTLVVEAGGGGLVLRRECFVQGEDFELEDARIRLTRRLGLAGLQIGEPLFGPYYERTELGLDTAGDAKYRQRVTTAGLAFLIVPVALDSSEEIRFLRLDTPDGTAIREDER